MARRPRNLTGESAPAAITGAVARVGAQIAAARTNRRWRQEDLARRAGLTRRVVMGIEAGRLGISFGAYVAALRAMGLDGDVALMASADRDVEGQTLAAARAGERVRLGGGLDDEF
jgi:transcriptional regulator with XRE-family HTH domain